MRRWPIPVVATAGAGFLVAAALILSGPAGAQFAPPSTSSVPAMAAASGSAPAPQPIVIQALDPSRFVVVTREPRLVQPVDKPGSATNMLVTVVTHYTVMGNQLVPIEHVRAPAGWRPILLAGE